jgi:carbamoyl-phosphate synthase large subunit
VSLLRAFQEAGAPYDLKVVAADMNPEMSSACQAAETSFKLPHISSTDYPQSLISYCKENGVSLVVPTLDTELAIISDISSELAAIGCEVAVSDRHFIDICRDKRKTASYFASLGLNSPEIFDVDSLCFPILVKPYDGSLSTGISILRSIDDVTQSILENPKNIYCQYLDHSEYSEYTCDAYFDRNGFIKCVVPRLRIEVRGGEISKGRTQKNDIMPFFMKNLRHLPGARGCLTIQIMQHNQTGALWLIEVNPRFGGGYPLTAKCGADYHKWLIQEYIVGENIDEYHDWKNDMLMLRYDAEIFIEQ